jgi:hypothetical protein
MSWKSCHRKMHTPWRKINLIMPSQEHFVGQARVFSVTRETVLMKA